MQATPSRSRLSVSIAALAAAGIALGTACADDGPREDPAKPAPRSIDYDWMSIATWNARHVEDVAVATTGGIDLLFVGDSITEGWAWNDGAVWTKHFAPLNAANFGIGGDRTQNVLWRLQNGSTGRLQPKVVVLLIGTNNLGNGDSPADTARGIMAVVVQLRTSFPSAKILLLGIFPTKERPDDPMRAEVAAVNTSIATLDDGRFVFFRDIGPVFLEADGSISPNVMPDFLHLSEEGYRRWADAIEPIITSWLQEP